MNKNDEDIEKELKVKLYNDKVGGEPNYEISPRFFQFIRGVAEALFVISLIMIAVALYMLFC